MRVLLILRPTAEIGGLERIVAHAATALESKSVECTLLLFGPDARDSAAYRFFAQEADVVCAKRWRDVLRAISWAEVVHVHAPTMTYWSTRLVGLARMARRPVVLTVHLPSEPRARNRLAGKVLATSEELLRAIYLRILNVRCYAPSEAAAAMASGRWRGLVHVSGLVQGIPDPGWTHPQADERKIRVALVGRLAEQKAPLVLLDAIALARAEGVAIEADVIGDGPLRDAVARRAQDPDLGPEAVTVRGHVADPLPLISRSSLLVLTSAAEGCPVVVMEAAALARPVLVREGLEGVEEILKGAYFTVPTNGGPNEFAEAFRRLSLDRNVLDEAGILARDRYEHGFSLTAAANRYVNAYRQALKLPLVSTDSSSMPAR